MIVLSQIFQVIDMSLVYHFFWNTVYV